MTWTIQRRRIPITSSMHHTYFQHVGRFASLYFFHREYVTKDGPLLMVCWQVVRPLLQERTRKKIQVLQGCGKDDLLKVNIFNWLWNKCILDHASWFSIQVHVLDFNLVILTQLLKLLSHSHPKDRNLFHRTQLFLWSDELCSGLLHAIEKHYYIFTWSQICQALKKLFLHFIFLFENFSREGKGWIDW